MTIEARLVTRFSHGSQMVLSAAQVARMVEGHMNPLNAYLNTMHVKTDVPPTRFSCFSCFGDRFMAVRPSEVPRFDFFTYVTCCLQYPSIAKTWWVNRRSLLASYLCMFVSLYIYMYYYYYHYHYIYIYVFHS